jgi:hypothetical protein
MKKIPASNVLIRAAALPVEKRHVIGNRRPEQ